jgi:hypothetical protein
LNGLREDAVPRPDHAAVDPGGTLVRAASPVLERMTTELEGTSVGLLLADHTARLTDVHCADRSIRKAIVDLGVVPGIRLGEDNVGTNAVGTPVETKQGFLVSSGGRTRSAPCSPARLPSGATSPSSPTARPR